MNEKYTGTLFHTFLKENIELEKEAAMKVDETINSTNEKHIGTSFDTFLEEEGIKEEVEVAAIKRIMDSDLTFDETENELMLY